jgi:transcriptional regulator with XRE-family HTH domain
MARSSRRSMHELVRAARYALMMTQLEFGRALGTSMRTAKRWEQGTSFPGTRLHQMVALLAPVDRALAQEIVDAAASVFKSLDWPLPQVPPAETAPGVTPGPAPAPAPAPAPSQASAQDLGDAVLCAVAEASDLPPRAVRPLLYAAFERARALGLTVEQLEQAFKPRADVKTRVARGELRLRVQVPEEAAGPLEIEPVSPERRRARGRSS